MGKFQKQPINQYNHKQNNHSNPISKNKNIYHQKINNQTKNQKIYKNKYHQIHHNQHQTNLYNNNSHLLTQSIFNIIPQGQYEDKFAALNSHNQQQNNHQQQSFQNQPQNQQIQQQQSNQQPEQFDQVEEQNQNDQQDQPQQSQMNNEDQPNKNNAIKLEINKIIQVPIQFNIDPSKHCKTWSRKSKQYYLQKLKSHAHLYYGYNNELIDHFLNFFNPAEMIEFFQANTIQTPLSIRTNTLKIKRKQLSQLLIQRGVNLDLLAEWSKVGMKIYDTKVPIGATPQYLAGSSLLSVLALDPQQNQKILDLASAPGGKTSYISQIMKNTGSVVANDLNKDRLRALRFNLNRLGVSNTLVTCRDGRKYSQIFPSAFDRVLVDAPCSNLGIISKKPSIKTNKVLSDIIKNSEFQKQLLLAAIDCTKVGGVIVYSTSSVSPLQNEQVINYAIKNKFIKIVEINDLIKIGDNGLTKFTDKKYHSDLQKTKRIYPHKHNLDGYYIAKLIKISQGNKQTKQNQQLPKKK